MFPRWLVPVVISLVLMVLLAIEAVRTAPIRGAMATCSELIASANQGDLEAARSLCSRSYLSRGGPRLAPEGGLVGLPRSIDKNFRAWRDGPAVLICPTGRIGPVYRFVPEADGWRYDGPAGVLGPSARLDHHQVTPRT